MRLLKLDRVLVLAFMFCCFQVRSQELLNDVTIKKINSGLFQVQYTLNPTNDYDVAQIVLKIYRKREGIIEEILSRNITNAISKSQTPNVYSYNWKPVSDEAKAGDELQAKIQLSYKPSLARSKSKSQNKTPHVDAGNTLELELPISKPIELNGTHSSDEDGKIVSAQWKQIAGPTNLAILKKDSLRAYANGEFKEGTYAFELSVKDDGGASAIARTILKVKSAQVVISTSPVTPTPKKDTPVIRKREPVPVTTVKNAEKLKGGPANAALNLLLPGLGHYFVSGNYKGEERKVSSFIVSGVYAASLGGAFYFNAKSDEQYKKYNHLADYREYLKDANGVVIGMRGANESEANKYLNDAQSAHRNSLICLGVAGGVMVGDIIYTFIKGSENKKKWQTASTTFRPKLFISSDGIQTIAGIQIKF